MSVVLVQPLAVFRAEPVIEFILIDAFGQSNVASVLEEPTGHAGMVVNDPDRT